MRDDAPLTPEEVKAIRADLGLATQTALARLLGVSRMTVSHWEAGTHAPSAAAAFALHSARKLNRKRNPK